MKRPSTPGSGFALIELMLAVTFGAFILTFLSRDLSRARVASNEREAIAVLRSIASAQARLASSAAMDSDYDGVGDYGYFGELAGSAPLRVYDPASDLPALDGNNLVLSPPLLPPAFAYTTLYEGEAEVVRGGYRFKMYLPGATLANHHIRGIPETGAAGVGGATPGAFPDPDNCEVLWGCYAWPDEVPDTGQRVFFLNQEGRLLQTANDTRSPHTVLFYDGPGDGPAYGAALSNKPVNQNAVTGMGALLGTPPRKANDGNLWTWIGR